LLKLAYEDEKWRISAGKLRKFTNAKDSDINKLKILYDRKYGVFNKGYGDLTWNDFTLNADGVKHYENSLNPATTKQPEQTTYKIPLDTISGETQDKLMRNYDFWNEAKHNNNHSVNIFEGISAADFLDMVRKADFSSALKKQKGITQRVRKNITILQSVLGEEWAEQAARNIGTTLKECQKRNDFGEWKRLKKLYK
jgi:hypothetical protein